MKVLKHRFVPSEEPFSVRELAAWHGDVTVDAERANGERNSDQNQRLAVTLRWRLDWAIQLNHLRFFDSEFLPAQQKAREKRKRLLFCLSDCGIQAHQALPNIHLKR